MDRQMSGVSARNELTRNKGMLYSQDHMGEWRLMPDLETDASEPTLADMES